MAGRPFSAGTSAKSAILTNAIDEFLQKLIAAFPKVLPTLEDLRTLPPEVESSLIVTMFKDSGLNLSQVVAAFPFTVAGVKAGVGSSVKDTHATYLTYMNETKTRLENVLATLEAAQVSREKADMQKDT